MLPFKIGWRFLKSSKVQTILIILGIAVGVSVQVFIGSLIQGLQKSLIDKTVGSSPQITIDSKNDNKQIHNYSNILNELNKKKYVKNISVALDNSAFITKGSKTIPILVRGLDLQRADKIYKIDNAITKEKKDLGKNEVLIGTPLASELKVKVGQKINVTTPKFKKQYLKIVGIYDLKVENINKSWTISNLDTAQKLFDTGNVITSFEMQVDDVFKADTISTNIRKVIRNRTDLKVNNWKEQNQQLLSGLSGQSASSNMIQFFVIISVVLGISSVLAITVMQKSKQIGILKAMGIKNRQASLIFLSEGLILGIFGAVIGIAFGLLLDWSFTKFALNPDGTPVVQLYINNTFIIQSGFIALVASLVASIIPALKSSKLDPIEVIKNG